MIIKQLKQTISVPHKTNKAHGKRPEIKGKEWPIISQKLGND